MESVANFFKRPIKNTMFAIEICSMIAIAELIKIFRRNFL